MDRALTLLGRRWQIAARAAIVAGVALPVLRIVELYPYEYIYFNDLSGGVRAADEHYELDYWGTSFAELGGQLEPKLRGLRAELGPEPIVARICGPLEASREVLPPGLLPVRDSTPGPLALAIAIFFCAPPLPGTSSPESSGRASC